MDFICLPMTVLINEVGAPGCAGERILRRDKPGRPLPLRGRHIHRGDDE